MPSASVLVPIYNVERYLPACLESLRAQQGDFEFVCLDDGSTDGSAKIAAEFVEKDDRFRLIQKANSGYGQLVRLIFEGSVTTNKPLIASMAMECGIAANILGASTRTIGNREYGYMLIEIPGGPDELARALNYIGKAPNVSVQVEAEYGKKEAAV